MANKLYNETSVQAIANAIRSKTGKADQYKISEMAQAIADITGSAKKNITWHQCPELPRRFVAEVTYDANDYSVSEIADYAPSTAVVSNYKPIGKVVDEETFYNAVPNTQTEFQTSQHYGILTPLDQVRYINTLSAPNVRDLGGWKCDGGAVKYGKLFRGGYLSASDRTVLVDELGIKHDLDLRGKTEANITESPLGADIYYTCPDTYNWYTLKNEDVWRINLRTVFDSVIHDIPLYFHCAAGADRTGTLACLLEGLLGVSQSDIDKDYELTSFWSGIATEDEARRRNGAAWSGLISEIAAKRGETFRDKCVTFAAELGFTAKEINDYRQAMIEGTPEAVTPAINTFNITRELVNATHKNEALTITEYQPFTDNVMANIDKVISEVQITMGGIDITNTAWQGVKTNLQRAVKIELIGCSVSNTNRAVIDGESYAAKVAPNTGYTLEDATISIKMGDIDMSEYYSSGVIAIPKVTGDISIKITAVESASKYINLIPSSLDMDWINIYNGNGYKDKTRYNSGATAADLSAGSKGTIFTTGLIYFSDGDKVRFSNCWFDPNATIADYGYTGQASNTFRYAQNSSSGTSLFDMATLATSSRVNDVVYDGTKIVGFTLQNISSTPYLKFSLACENGPENAKIYIET